MKILTFKLFIKTNMVKGFLSPTERRSEGVLHCYGPAGDILADPDH